MSAALGALVRACAVCRREFRPRTLAQRLCSLACVARHPRAGALAGTYFEGPAPGAAAPVTHCEAAATARRLAGEE